MLFGPRPSASQAEARASAKAEAEAIKDRFAKHGSNKGFHYLGSPKIYCDMGRAFAQGMIKLMDGQGK